VVITYTAAFECKAIHNCLHETCRQEDVFGSSTLIAILRSYLKCGSDKRRSLIHASERHEISEILLSNEPCFGQL